MPRRKFLQTAGGVVLGASGLSMLPAGRVWAQAADTTAAASTPESLVKILYDSLSPAQREKICFAWDYMDPERGLLRTRVSANWDITSEYLVSSFYTDDQRALVRKIHEGIYNPAWHERIDKQLDDDAGGFGQQNSFAIFGEPGTDKFEFVMSGRHQTIRCDGNSTEHVAFGGPVFYGHAAGTGNEGPDHPGNVYWPQALVANRLYDMLDRQQQEAALVPGLPRESQIGFQGPQGNFPGIKISELSSDQKEHVQEVLQVLIDPYRQSDQDEIVSCVKTQGGIDACSLAFYAGGDIGDDKVWDCWRLEGPAFVWYFRGSPHVHVWVNVANDPSVATNS